ncbi:hypothetical protein AG1IA_00738 [Rhizoctonia solani AG-1 IA]|uniref:Uncharacterized protein n=1 Tax=Thanatephorus cucumeris (strain AG1-IA) TaxID=983506 RepID=L8X812_THACA|nr:hypothetical protein AG1IA_00738 [Rhizoctonia solani AG-1 IA]
MRFDVLKTQPWIPCYPRTDIAVDNKDSSHGAAQVWIE